MSKPRSPRERQEFVDALTQRFRELVEQSLAELEQEGVPVTLDRIESTVTQIKERLGRELQQEILEQQPDAPENRQACPRCAGSTRFRACSERLLLTRHGEVRLRRRWFYCPPCQAGFAPLDRRLGLDAQSTSTYLRTLLAEWGTDRPFHQCAADVWRTLGVAVGQSTVERTAVAAGERRRAAVGQEAAAFEAGTLPPPLHTPRVLHISMDGVFAPLREAWKRDGSAGPLACRFGECKVGAVYETRPTARGRQRLAWREYTATFADITHFRPQLATLAYRCGAAQAATVVFLADGALCNWNLAQDYFPEAVQIVDWWHAVQHLGAVAEAYYGTRTGPAAAWLAARKRELWDGRVEAVQAAIALLPMPTSETQELRAREEAFFTQNARRMQYAHFRAAGYQIGSGIVEASCRTVVQQRFDQSGMHWRVETADALVALRAARLSSTDTELRPYCTPDN